MEMPSCRPRRQFDCQRCLKLVSKFPSALACAAECLSTLIHRQGPWLSVMALGHGSHGASNSSAAADMAPGRIRSAPVLRPLAKPISRCPVEGVL